MKKISSLAEVARRAIADEHLHVAALLDGVQFEMTVEKKGAALAVWAIRLECLKNRIYVAPVLIVRHLEMDIFANDDSEAAGEVPLPPHFRRKLEKVRSVARNDVAHIRLDDLGMREAEQAVDVTDLAGEEFSRLIGVLAEQRSKVSKEALDFILTRVAARVFDPIPSVVWSPRLRTVRP